MFWIILYDLDNLNYGTLKFIATHHPMFTLSLKCPINTIHKSDLYMSGMTIIFKHAKDIINIYNIFKLFLER